MNYLLAVLADRIKAEEAYVALEKEGLALDRIAILGRGYKSPDEFGLIDSKKAARKQALLMAIWLVPFGFGAGVTFSLITGLNTFAWAGEIGNNALGGLLGAISGAMGSFFVGGGVGLVFRSNDALQYRNRLREGKYVVAVKGSKGTLQNATRILRQFQPETLERDADSE